MCIIYEQSQDCWHAACSYAKSICGWTATCAGRTHVACKCQQLKCTTQPAHLQAPVVDACVPEYASLRITANNQIQEWYVFEAHKLPRPPCGCRRMATAKHTDTAGAQNMRAQHTTQERAVSTWHTCMLSSFFLNMHACLHTINGPHPAPTSMHAMLLACNHANTKHPQPPGRQCTPALREAERTVDPIITERCCTQNDAAAYLATVAGHSWPTRLHTLMPKGGNAQKAHTAALQAANTHVEKYAH